MQIKRRRNKSSKFIPNLHKILTDKDSGAFWRQDGKTFILNDMTNIIQKSLPKYFRHSNISSFIRQLNLYGFKKVVGENAPQNTYYHQKFKRNQVTELKPIRSFYNQQKYGSSKVEKKVQDDLSYVQSVDQKNQQSSFMKADEQLIENDQISYSQKIKFLQKQNARLKLIQEEHIRLVNYLNQLQGTIRDDNKVKSLSGISPYNFIQTKDGYPFDLNWGQSHPVSFMNAYYNWTVNRNAYYIPFQKFE